MQVKSCLTDCFKMSSTRSDKIQTVDSYVRIHSQLRVKAQKHGLSSLNIAAEHPAKRRLGSYGGRCETEENLFCREPKARKLFAALPTVYSMGINEGLFIPANSVLCVRECTNRITIN